MATLAAASARPPPFLFAHLPIIRRRAAILAFLFTILGFTIVLATAHGAASIAYDDVIRLLMRGVGLPIGLDLPASDFTILMAIRLPRVLIGALVGGALAASGVLMQGLFRNPLADPGLLGVGSGGALAAVIAIMSGAAAQSLWALPATAFVGSVSTAFLVYAIAVRRGRADTATLLLAGVAMSSFLGALISALLLSSKDYNATQAILGWLIGGLSGRGWDHLGVAVLPVTIGLIIASTYARDLNLLMAGEDSAQALGVDVPRTRLILLALASLMTGAAVSIAGGVAFIGLIVPHLLRLLIGPDHRVLLPASALAGAALLTLADTAARVLVRPAELQVGVITALLGAPFFLFLLWHKRQSE